MNDIKRLQDILNAIESIEGYAVPSYEKFLEDGKTQDAILYNLIIIGEAANRVSVSYQRNHPEIPWASLAGTRNIIVHGYDQVKLQIVWKIIESELAQLKSNIQLAIDGHLSNP